MLAAMDDRTIARTLGAMRIGFGAGMLLAPGLAVRIWLGRDADTTAARVMSRAIGVRDLVLGFGTLRSLDEGRARGWLEAGAAADLVDSIASGLGARAMRRPMLWAVAVSAAAAAAVGARTASAIGSRA